ncbi:hypothetical protein CHS0354_033317, partial [Potamilus streckersoni]
MAFTQVYAYMRDKCNIVTNANVSILPAECHCKVPQFLDGLSIALILPKEKEK